MLPQPARLVLPCSLGVVLEAVLAVPQERMVTTELALLQWPLQNASPEAAPIGSVAWAGQQSDLLPAPPCQTLVVEGSFSLAPSQRCPHRSPVHCAVWLNFRLGEV